MPNVAIAALLACAVMIGSIGAVVAQSNATASPPVPASKSAPLLPPGGAAGIKRAQGADWSGPLIGAAVTGGIFLVLLLVVDSDDTGPVTSTPSP